MFFELSCCEFSKLYLKINIFRLSESQRTLEKVSPPLCVKNKDRQVGRQAYRFRKNKIDKTRANPKCVICRITYCNDVYFVSSYEGNRYVRQRDRKCIRKRDIINLRQSKKVEETIMTQERFNSKKRKTAKRQRDLSEDFRCLENCRREVLGHPKIKNSNSFPWGAIFVFSLLPFIYLHGSTRRNRLAYLKWCNVLENWLKSKTEIKIILIVQWLTQIVPIFIDAMVYWDR